MATKKSNLRKKKVAKDVQRKRKREKKSAQRYRDKLKSDPKKYEEYKAKERERKRKAKSEGRIKSMNQLSTRQQRAKRTKMKLYMRNYRLKRRQSDNMDGFVNDDNNLGIDAGTNATITIGSSRDPVPSLSPDINGNILGFQKSASFCTSKQKRAGRKLVRKNQAKVYRVNKELQNENKKLQRQIWVLQKRISRKRKELQRTPNLTPSKKLQKLTQGKFVPSTVKKALFKGLVVEEECKLAKKNVETSLKSKTVYARIFSGKVVKKYKLLRECKDLLFPRLSLKGRKWMGDNANVLKVNFKANSCDVRKRKAVLNYFLSDDASHPTPGKKDFVIVDKEKLPKRYLNAPMHTLYPKFLRQCGLVVSYATFCKFRPRNVVHPKLSGRDTCLCEKCDNFKFVMNSLKAAKVIDFRSREALFTSLCCDTENANCLLRSCSKCKNKQLDFTVTDRNKKISYRQWVHKKVPHRTDPKKTMSISKIKNKECTINECIILFKEMLFKMMCHVGRIVHCSPKTTVEIVASKNHRG